MTKPKTPVFEIRSIRTFSSAEQLDTGEARTDVVERIKVLPHQVIGAKRLCECMQDALDQAGSPTRVYLFKDNIPISAAYGREEKHYYGKRN